MRYCNFTEFTPMEASHEDPHTAAIKAKLQSKEWQENAVKNNIFSGCEEPTKTRRDVPLPPIRKFTTLNLGKRQRIN
ncbi:hypothetical protein QTG54_005303 [Skeletonema marinoi]|uniref:Uncharacterized protein n=1 Tax=Skeletonema marinoi TaxID=267567 RepID=A0AAD8YC32_9STRA|nr:hypothetical protein QTG54_005303 [Skeletonema marinoi]